MFPARAHVPDPPHLVHPPGLAALLSDCAALAPAQALRRLIDAGHDRAPLLPFPAAGATLKRWRVLAQVGGHDLALAKLFEGHTDALAILHEAAVPAPPAGSIWGTWCAEPPNARLMLHPAGPGGAWVLDGRKAWCSGARDVSDAVVSCWRSIDGAPMLATVDLRQDGVSFDGGQWQAVGMRDSGSIDVLFDRVPAQPLGASGFYVERPGFWHGGAGVAACWHGAACTLAQALQRQLRARAGAADPHRLAQLGELGVALAAAAALLRETAAAFDADPLAPAMAAALAARLAVEQAASSTLALASRAFGAGPLCQDAALARLFADLPVFMRQSHAERDLAALGASWCAGADGADREPSPWML